MSSRTKEISDLLSKALLEKEQMDYDLYKFELEEHLQEWYAGLKADRNNFVLVVTENSGSVAMVLISKDKTVYVNEDGREKLSTIWKFNYENNVRLLLPAMANDIDSGFFSVTGITVVDKSKRRWTKTKGFAR
ncbi:hypothetical protein [Pseudanabaena sp. Chao 1811]|uniref:hypothetical protein n=1 Tax=Pseudanabaena sp. Chao 1811 TaxID=2963092 RepID=UPI0022F39819|nr:hypothetical protein [Pseudanabaena sp. Chao 1811]